MIFSSPLPHFGQRCTSMSKTRSSSPAQPMRPGRCLDDLPLIDACRPLRHHLRPLIRQRRAREVTAQMLQPLALVGFAAHGRMQAETIDVDAQRLARRGLARLGDA